MQKFFHSLFSSRCFKTQNERKLRERLNVQAASVKSGITGIPVSALSILDALILLDRTNDGQSLFPRNQ
jgi:hypothetical protein